MGSMSVLCCSSRRLVCLAIGWSFISANVGVVTAYAVANELSNNHVEARDWRLLIIVVTVLLVIILPLAIWWWRWSRQRREPQAFVPPPIVLPPLIDDDSDSDQQATPEK